MIKLSRRLLCVQAGFRITLQLLALQERNHQGLLTCMAPLPDGERVVLAGRKVALWSIVGEQPDHLFLEPSKSAKYDVDKKSIEIPLGAIGLLDAADQYIEAMESLGWKPDTGGIKADDYVMLTFTKNNDESGSAERGVAQRHVALFDNI